MKSDADRGPWGTWARKERLGREWTVEEVVARVQQEAGVRMDVATLRGIEGGSKKPSVRLQDALALVFGSRAVEPTQAVADSALAAVLEAVRLQTAELHQLWSIEAERSRQENAILREMVSGLTSLVEEIRADREERAGRTGAAAVQFGTLEAGIDELLERTTPAGGSVEPPARAGSGQ